jgi:PEP-CTERM motif
MNATGTLRLEFDANHWDSTISFQPGIPVTLGGTLELTFAPGVDIAAQSGRTIDLFDWTGVTPTGAFTISSPYSWNLSKLYTTGEVTLSLPLSGDYNGNGMVGPEDYNLWKTSFGSTTNLAADGNGNHIIDAADYTMWRDHFNAASLTLTGDYNHDGKTDAADYTLWRDSLGSTTNLAADGNGNGTIDAGDFDVWKTNFGAVSLGTGAGSGAALPSANPLSATVPEPATLVLLLLGMMARFTARRAAAHGPGLQDR